MGLYTDLYMYDLFRPCTALCWLADGDAGVVLASAPDAAGACELTHAQLPGNLSSHRTPVHDRRDFGILATASCPGEVCHVRSLARGEGAAGAAVVVASTSPSYGSRLHLWSLPEEGADSGCAEAEADDYQPRCWEVACPPTDTAKALPAGRETCLLIDGADSGGAFVVAATPDDGRVWGADFAVMGASDGCAGWAAIAPSLSAGGADYRPPLVGLKCLPGASQLVLTANSAGVVCQWDCRDGARPSAAAQLQCRPPPELTAPVRGFDAGDGLALCVCADAVLVVTDLRRTDRPLAIVPLLPPGELHPSGPSYEVHLSPAPWQAVSVSGFPDGTVRLYDLRHLLAAAGANPGSAACGTDAHLPAVFRHRGHEVEHAAAVAEGGARGLAVPHVTHSWHPLLGTTVLSADDRGGLQAWAADVAAL